MSLLVASCDSFERDPRTSNLLSSLIKLNLPVGVLEIQTLVIGFGSIFHLKNGSILKKFHNDSFCYWKTWTSRSVAQRHLLTCLDDQDSSLINFKKLLKNYTLNATEQYLVNQFCLAYESLRLLLTSPEGAGITLIVAEDLQSAFGGVLLSKELGVSVCYDAHELFTDAVDLFGADVSPSLLEIFRQIEIEVWNSSNLLVTVSPGLADVISMSCNSRQVIPVPNFSPLRNEPLIEKSSSSVPLEYVYFGGAAPYRNVDVLVKNWPLNDDSPTLSLYVPKSKWEKEVRGLSKLNPNIKFCDPVSTTKLLSEMSKYDIGIIPYAYPPPYDLASPNKFGEYIAAGLPVLAHPQPFTSYLINKYNIGIICDITSRQDLKNSLSSMNRESYQGLQSAVSKAFKEYLNWDKAIEPMTEEILNHMNKSNERPKVDVRQIYNKDSLVKTTNSYVDFVLEIFRPYLKTFGTSGMALKLSRWVPKSVIRRLA